MEYYNNLQKVLGDAVRDYKQVMRMEEFLINHKNLIRNLLKTFRKILSTQNIEEKPMLNEVMEKLQFEVNKFQDAVSLIDIGADTIRTLIIDAYHSSDTRHIKDIRELHKVSRRLMVRGGYIRKAYRNVFSEVYRDTLSIIQSNPSWKYNPVKPREETLQEKLGQKVLKRPQFKKP
jgi:hypothetical protein